MVWTRLALRALSGFAARRRLSRSSVSGDDATAAVSGMRAIGASTVVGEEGSVFDVVEIRLGGGSHAHARRRSLPCLAHPFHFICYRNRRSAFHRRHVVALLERRENLVRRREAEIGQHDDDFL